MDISTEFTHAIAPGALPVLGHAPHLMRDPLKFLGSLSGHGDLVTIRLGPRRAYVPCHPEILRHMLVDYRTFDKGGPLYERAREVFGESLGLCPHARHRHQRRMLQPAFGADNIAAYGAIMEQQITALTASWRGGHAFEAFPAFFRLSANTAMRMIFGAGCTDEAATAVQQSIATLTRGLAVDLLLPKVTQRLPLPVIRRQTKARETFLTSMDRLVAEHRVRPHPASLLALLLDAQGEDGRPLTSDQLREQAIAFLSAGTDTTAAALTWMFLLLAGNATAQRQLEDEVDRVLHGRPARFADLPELPYTRRVVTEALRMRPPGWVFTRATTARTTIAGQVLEPGSLVLISPCTVQHRPDVYAQPEEFSPDRWLPEHASALPRGSFAAFSNGGRKCIGDEFAMTEATLTLATVASRWRLTPEPQTDPRPKTLATTLLPRRMRLRVTPRHESSTEPGTLADTNSKRK
ncbi:cytochrome P450 [Streptomyces johnsoniae]|uniref:Cytochrome P450 n=1 Tax=Streptomyces johnsoniae TaxID=3075532 RepID=A0ABU2S9S6_9ACTN|nr:cytochrome P450 [Streptomyces sp. DSM 41886]MDT0444569.1 cytochrome P450 [Streptomyces sp. DSM 41886]